MNQSLVLQELEALAEDLAVEVRYDALDTRGGLCRYKGRVCLIASRDLSVSDRIRLLCEELSRLPLGNVFIRPQIRALLERANPA